MAAILVGKDLNPPRPGKYVVKWREGGRQRWRTFDSHDAAKDHHARVHLASRQRSGQPVVDGTITLDDYTAKWLETIKVSDRTRENYRAVYRNHVQKVLGAFKVRDITRGHIKDLLERRKAAPTTVGLDRAVIRAILSAAVEDEIVLANVAAGRFTTLRLERKDGAIQDEVEAKALDAEQLTRLLAEARGSRDEYVRRLYPSFLFGARTGARLCEIIGVRWVDLDLDAGHVTFRLKISRRHRGVLKSGHGRVVDLSPDLVGALRRLRAERETETLRNGWGAVPEYVFCTDVGTHYSDTRWRKAFKKCAKAAGLAEHFSPHSLRHSFASLLLQSGASVEHVSRLLGHATLALTVRVYGRWLRPNTRGTVALLDSIAPVGPRLKAVGRISRTRGSRAVATAV